MRLYHVSEKQSILEEINLLMKYGFNYDRVHL